jgi:hypothetical protein
MANGSEDEEIRLRVVYEATQVVKDAIADIRKLKEETGELTKEQEKTLITLEYQKTLLEGAGSGLDHYTELVHEDAQAQKLMRQMLEETDAELQVQATLINTTVNPALQTAGIGFEGMARQAFAAERVMTVMSGAGGGLARAGPLLDGVIKSLGGPAGLGFAIVGIEFAVERALPALEKLWDKLNGVDEMAKEAADTVAKLLKDYEKLEETPTEVEKKTKAMVTKAITEHPGKAADIAARVEQGLGPLEQFMTPEEAGKVAHLQRYKAAGEPGGPLLGLEEQVQDITQRAHKARAEQAKAFVAQLPTSRETRDTLRAMGVMGGGFLTELGLAEPEAQAEQKQIVDAEKAAGKEMETTRTKIKAENRENKDNVKYDEDVEKMIESSDKAARDRETKQERERVGYNAEVGRIEGQIFTESQRADAKAAAAKARQDAKTARENTFAHRRHAAIEAQHEQVAGAVEGANEQFGFARTPGQLEEVTRGAVSNVNMGMDLASAVQMAVAQTEQKIQRDFMRGMQRQASYGEMRGQ